MDPVVSKKYVFMGLVDRSVTCKKQNYKIWVQDEAFKVPWLFRNNRLDDYGKNVTTPVSDFFVGPSLIRISSSPTVYAHKVQPTEVLPFGGSDSLGPRENFNPDTRIPTPDFGYSWWTISTMLLVKVTCLLFRIFLSLDIFQ